ncbi:tripartite tricarboxylate transporter substrate binding protein [Roseomonas sp. HF4]|uniref:Bug family tripartite tricarboxylate transporter substrate binding protein n=1 Tax=Roseomonas sp. HF4 TaxID=2562313 RepID=UPI0010C12FDE|nr:tripartite tricarboxylate transporter substrate binding protein [Roseomonas sp. HF4]
MDRRTLLGAMGALPLLAPAVAHAAWPERPIRIIVPFAPGGPSDILSRLLAPKMSATLGQPVVVENRPGAGGVTGVDAAAKSAADGYTIVLGSAGGLAISPHLGRGTPYDPLRDLVPLTLGVLVPEPLVVPAATGFTSFAELIAAARARPGALNYGSAGPGGMPHLAAELLRASADIDVTHVPYRGGAPLALALVQNEVQLGFADLPVLLPHIRSGVLRALAVGAERRVPWLPDVPTTTELGHPTVRADNWHGFVAPARVPEDALAALHGALSGALKDPEVARALDAQGAIPVGNSREEFGAFLRAENEKWSGVIRRANIRID